MKSESRHEIRGRGLALMIKMPCECPRSMDGVLKALGGNPVTVDDEQWEVSAVGMFMPATPIHAGEAVELIVTPATPGAR